MLYDDTFYLGHIFQAFLHDTIETMAHVRGILSYDEVRRTDGEVSLNARLLAWLERQCLVLDVAHVSTLLQIAHAYEACANRDDVSQTLRRPGVAGAALDA